VNRRVWIRGPRAVSPGLELAHVERAQVVNKPRADDNPKDRRTILILSQVYPPDPASVGQHMADAAAELARRGWRVRVVTANRGYDDASIKYQPRELRDGVEVRRVPLSSFGKKSIPLRALAMGIFMLHCLIAGLFTRRLAAILVSTSPPMCGFAAAITHMIRRTPFVYWVMDLNPDQLIELGQLEPGSLVARFLNALQRSVLERASHVVPLDRFMAERLSRKLDVSSKSTVMPPWPHNDPEKDLAHGDNPWRAAQGLEGSFVVMYSGNHTPSNPVWSVFEAARRLEGREEARDIRFLFVGGGLEKRRIDAALEERPAGNIASLPYQPFETLRQSLGAADVHVVSVGDHVVGVVHPCKIYGAMAVGRPVLLIGPDPCHASEIIDRTRAGWRIGHGDADAAERAVLEIARTPRDELRAMGQRAREYVASEVSRERLCGRLCSIIEQCARGAPRDEVHAETPQAEMQR